MTFCRNLGRACLVLPLLTGLSGCLGLGAHIGYGGGRPHVGVSVSGRVNPGQHHHKQPAPFVRIEAVNHGVINVPAGGRVTINVTINSNTGARIASNPSCTSIAVQSVGPGKHTIAMDVFGVQQRGSCRMDLIATANSNKRTSDKVSLPVNIY